jgi:hypothetical protein
MIRLMISFGVRKIDKKILTFPEFSRTLLILNKVTMRLVKRTYYYSSAVCKSVSVFVHFLSKPVILNDSVKPLAEQLPVADRRVRTSVLVPSESVAFQEGRPGTNVVLETLYSDSCFFCFSTMPTGKF